MLPAKILTHRGYSIEKKVLNSLQIAMLEKQLTVTPQVPPSYAGMVAPFKVWIESPARYYLPRAWAESQYGPADSDARSNGEALPKELCFGGDLRPHQVEALAAYRAAGHNGIICLPCGYGKTFTGIAAAAELGVCFLIVVHKEFLADQWSEELKRLLPGIRIGRIQGERCDLDCDVAIAMIQTICSRSYPTGTFARFGFAIFDEVHHLGAEHFSQSLQRIHCRRMLGLTATPKRADGLSKVFEWNLGAIVYQINRRPLDDTVLVECLRYACEDPAYANVSTDWKGGVVRARMINSIADYKGRTAEILAWIKPYMEEAGRNLLVLSDRREHLVDFDAGFRAIGIDSVGYYVGGMKQKDLDISATKRVILGTFAMASEGMNIPSLNAVLLATPKSNIEQSVGRILRLKKEERTVQPIIFDVLDTTFVECYGQWTKRKKFYKECGYRMKWAGSDEEMEAPVSKEPKGCIILEDEEIAVEEVAVKKVAVKKAAVKKAAVKNECIIIP